MKFIESKLKGAFILELEPLEDERGFFARTFCAREFGEHGAKVNFVQNSVSFNKKKGTLRGMHFQIKPYEENKLVSCIRGSAYDVWVDLRPDSSTFRQWDAIELTAGNRRAVFIPAGFAHGFQTLKDSTELLYQISQYYSAPHARGVRWDDPVLDIKWPLKNPFFSSRDGGYPLLKNGLNR